MAQSRPLFSPLRHKKVGAVRFELTTSWSQTKRAAGLRYAPRAIVYFR